MVVDVTTWTIFDLDSLLNGDGGHGFSTAYDINDDGYVVGDSNYYNGPENYVFKGTYWDPDHIAHPLEDPGFPDDRIHGVGINSLGMVAGQFEPTGVEVEACYWPTLTGNIVNIGHLPDDDPNPYAFAYKVNDSGVIVGASLNIFVTWRPFMWDGTIHLLPNSVHSAPYGPGQINEAHDINNNGRIVGHTNLIAVYWDPPYTEAVEIAYGEENFADIANGVNSIGHIVGEGRFVSSPFVDLAFLWNGVTLTNLGTADGLINSTAHDINDSGTIVGDGYDPTYTYDIPLVWENGIAARLPLLPDGHQGQAFAINSHGVIAGWSEGQINDGFGGTFIDNKAVLWVPTYENNILSTVATIDHDVLIGVEEDQHHSRAHALAGPDHVGGFHTEEVPGSTITDGDFSAPTDGMVAMTLDNGTQLIWVRMGGGWGAVEVT